MNPPEPEEGAPPEVTPLTSLTSSPQRRPIFLLLLAIGVALVFVWLPESARAYLWAALSGQRRLVALLSVFALTTLSLLWSAGQRLDARIFLLLNMHGYPGWLDRLMWLCTQLGNMLVALIAAFTLFVLNAHRLAVEILLGSLTLWMVVTILKALTARARPFLTLEKSRIVGWRARGDSFPSGHTAQAFFLMTLFLIQFRFGLFASAALFAVAVLVGFTRIYVGAHYPRDVLAGMVVGSVWGTLAMMVDRYWAVLRL